MSIKLSDEEKAENVAYRAKRRAEKKAAKEAFDKVAYEAGRTLYEQWRAARDRKQPLQQHAAVEAACVAMDVAYLAACRAD